MLFQLRWIGIIVSFDRLLCGCTLKNLYSRYVFIIIIILSYLRYILFSSIVQFTLFVLPEFYLKPLSIFGKGRDRRGKECGEGVGRSYCEGTICLVWLRENLNEDGRRRESNPGLPNAKPILYHWATAARYNLIYVLINRIRIKYLHFIFLTWIAQAIIKPQMVTYFEGWWQKILFGMYLATRLGLEMRS